MAIYRNTVDTTKFNDEAALPFELRIQDFQSAIRDVYDFFFDLNSHLIGKGLQNLTLKHKKLNSAPCRNYLQMK